MTKIIAALQSYKNNLCSEKVNAGRQEEIDFARGLAVLFMVLVHVLEVYGVPRVQDSAFGYVIEFLGSPPAAPVFMLLMGVSIAFSRRTSPKAMTVRGIKIFFLGYVLSFSRSFLPMIIGLRSNIFTVEDLEPDTLLTLLTEIDILQFAGLALIFLGFLEGVKINFSWSKGPPQGMNTRPTRAIAPYFQGRKVYYLVIAVIISLASPLLWGFTTGVLPLDFLLDPLWGNAYYVYFPFFSWIFYPLIGVYLGNHLVRAKDKRIYYKGITVAGLFLLVIGSLVSITNISTHIGDYWRHGLGGNLWFTGFVLIWWALLFFLLKKRVLPAPFLNRMYFWSKNVTSLYFIHWVIIGWGALLLGFESSPLFLVIILMVVFVVLSDRLTYAWTVSRIRTGR